jgi:3-oxoadipate enol-lactonase
MQVEANCIRMNVSVEGPEDAPVVTLGHSLAANLQMWRPQMAELSRRYRVVRYDARGHGGTERPAGPFTLRDLAQDVRALLERLGTSRTHFVGLSLGGMIGQQIAVDHPDLLESMVLADTLSAYGPESVEMWEGRIAAASGQDGMEPLVEPTVTRWFTAEFREARPDQIDWVRGMIRATHPDGFIGCSRALMRLNLADRLRALKVSDADPGRAAGSYDAGLRFGDHPGCHPRIADQSDRERRTLSSIEQPEAFSAALRRFASIAVRVESRTMISAPFTPLRAESSTISALRPALRIVIAMPASGSLSRP